MQKMIILVIALLLNPLARAKDDFLSVWEAANVLEIFDHVSGWHPSAIADYQKYFSALNLAPEGQNHIYEWERIRSKYARNVEGAARLSFMGAGTKSTDVISFAFYNHSTVQKALGSLAKALSREELTKMGQAMIFFKGPISKIMAKMRSVEGRMEDLNKKLKKKGRYFSDVHSFFGHKKANVKLHFIWSPSQGDPVVDYSGRFVLFRINPEKHTGLLNEQILAESLTFAYFSFFGIEELSQIEKRFTGSCQVKKIAGVEDAKLFFETPLVKALGGHFYRQLSSNKKNFDLYSVDYQPAWVSVFSRSLFQLFLQFKDQQRKFSDGFVELAGKLCSEHIAPFSK